MPKGQKTNRGGVVSPIKTLSANRPTTADIELALIDEPERAMRETMDEDKLALLVDSMRAYGLIQPIAVKKSGARFRILAGHRRFIAAHALGWPKIRASVYPEACGVGEAIKAHENTMREEVNPAEECNWLWHVLEVECEGDVDILTDKLQMRRDFVEARLNLKRGDEQVFSALARGQVNVGVAKELNAVKDPLRRKMYLQAAIEGGAAERLVKAWRIEGNALDALQPCGPITIPEGGLPQVNPPIPKIECYFCGDGPGEGMIETLFIHKVCLKNWTRALERLRGGQSEDDNV